MILEVEQLQTDTTLIRLKGRLDAAAAPDLLAHLNEAVAEGRNSFIIDLAEASFIDSTGLGALVSGFKAARKSGGDLRLAAPSPQVQRLLRLTTLDRVFSIVETPRASQRP
ncbi:STAS domain-containing protein [Microvirga arsenatis]|uniref:Anti-sigma factor antagonist n=1 Tax=Microvirga arsenatis TaxID=2692265 RepID=A0ABW9YS15_9HYPH|nr:STAS domain-containing protein [Microvirga arsenatis]NBJ10011.1 anti-sigma factor antagonist [Microvirga arsenatis]NBJ23079.1 anti-sigma factor antagonist [Microvirga arsenatis]